jgi:hypothetical protein
VVTKVLGLLALSFCLSANAYDLTLESGIGHQGEMEYRVGPRFRVSEHWLLDTGVAAVRYKDEHYDHHYEGAGPSGHVFDVDAVLLRQIKLGDAVYLVLGTGPSVWTHARFGAQAHGHAWMFSNKVGVNWRVNERAELGLGVQHYSCLWCKPNSSIDFVGLQLAWRLK